MEVLAGSDPASDAGIRMLLGLFALLKVTPEIAERAVVIRRSTRLKLPDAIILATAEIEGRVLVTRNTRDFTANQPGVHIPYVL